METFKILKQVGRIAYDLDLPLEMVTVYPVFHVSMSKKFVSDSSSIVPVEDVGIKRIWHIKRFQ